MNPADIRMYRAAMKSDPEVQVYIKGLGTKDKEFVVSDVIVSKEFAVLQKKFTGEDQSKIAKTFALRASTTLTEKDLIDTFYTADEGNLWELKRIKENSSAIIDNPNPEEEEEEEGGQG